MNKLRWVKVLPCQDMASIQGQLTQESALRPPVALPKGVNGVDLGVVISHSIRELVADQSAKMRLACQLAQYVAQVSLNVLGGCEHTPRLGQWNASKLSCPEVDVLEDETVKCLQVVEIVGPLDPGGGKLRKSQSACLSLTFGEHVSVLQTRKVAQHVGAGVRVGVSHSLTGSLGQCEDEAIRARPSR